ncbi:MAG: DNA-binding protein [Candidatus Coproplasma sp.]
MDKLRFMRLWDLYGGLLTPTQREITDMYFNLDLTISEIAEQKGISRQGVSDCLGICKKELEEYEKRLGHDKLISEGEKSREKILSGARLWADEFLRLHPEYAEDIAKLYAVFNGEEVLDELKK